MNDPINFTDPFGLVKLKEPKNISCNIRESERFIPNECICKRSGIIPNSSKSKLPRTTFSAGGTLGNASGSIDQQGNTNTSMVLLPDFALFGTFAVDPPIKSENKGTFECGTPLIAFGVHLVEDKALGFQGFYLSIGTSLRTNALNKFDKENKGIIPFCNFSQNLD